MLAIAIVFLIQSAMAQTLNLAPTQGDIRDFCSHNRKLKEEMANNEGEYKK